MKLLILKNKIIVALVALSVASASAIFLYKKHEQNERFGKLFDLYKVKDSIDLVNLMPLVEQGNSKSNFLLGEHYLRKGDTSRAMVYFQKSLDGGEVIYGGWKMSVCQGLELQKQWWKNNLSEFINQAENSDDWYLQFHLAANIINEGKSLTGNNDTALALKLMTKSAQLGYPSAIRNMASFYYYGWGTPVDYKESFKWAKNGADIGDVSSQATLGKFYMGGIGVKQSKELGLKYAKLAANKGNSDAQFALAQWYYNGLGGLAVDESASMKWAELASRNGNENASKLIQEYKKKQQARAYNSSYGSGYESVPTCTCKWCGKLFYATKKDAVSQAMSNFMSGYIESLYGVKEKASSYECADYCSRRCEVEASYYR